MQGSVSEITSTRLSDKSVIVRKERRGDFSLWRATDLGEFYLNIISLGNKVLLISRRKNFAEVVNQFVLFPSGSHLMKDNEVEKHVLFNGKIVSDDKYVIDALLCALYSGQD